MTVLDWISDDILATWGVSALIQFEEKLDALVTSLRTNKELCPQVTNRGYRRCVLTKQTSLLYRASADEIQIIALLINLTDHPYFR